MYDVLLILHSWLRWVVVFAAVAALFNAYRGWFGDLDWKPAHRKVNLAFVISMDVQLVIGLVLYVFLSPVTEAAFADFGAAMKERVLRFWAVEHFSLMVVALIFAHVGNALVKRAEDGAKKFKRAAIFFTLAILAVLAAIPWPFLEVGRPLFRL